MLPPRISRKSDKADRGKRSPAHRGWKLRHPFVALHADPDTIVRFNACVGSWGDCWLWDFSMNEKGYGVFHAEGLKLTAHRASYMLHKGPICGGLHVLHSCDVRNCVNPDHLRLGTHQENMADMMSKGRHGALRGERANGAKLNANQVLLIREAPGRAVDVGAKFGVSKSLVLAIRNRQVWKHI